MSFSQNNDSLQKVFNDKTLADTIRLTALDELAWRYNSHNPDSSIILAEQEAVFAHSANLKKYEASTVSIIGVAYENKGNYPKALEYYLKALKINEERENKNGIANCYNDIGVVYEIQSEYSKALEYYFKALKIREEKANKKGMANCYNNIANVYKKQI